MIFLLRLPLAASLILLQLVFSLFLKLAVLDFKWFATMITSKAMSKELPIIFSVLLIQSPSSILNNLSF